MRILNFKKFYIERDVRLLANISDFRTELSKMVGVNRTTLSQCFRKVYGVTIFDFLRTFRLEESKRLLRAGNRSVTQVAYEVGYSQQKTFSREFKKYFGDTPSDSRSGTK